MQSFIRFACLALIASLVQAAPAPLPQTGSSPLNLTGAADVQVANAALASGGLKRILTATTTAATSSSTNWATYYQPTTSVPSIATAAASPASIKRLVRRQATPATVDVVFQGAAGVQFTKTFSTSGSEQNMTTICEDPASQQLDAISVSHIAGGADGVSCTFYGVDNSVTTIQGLVDEASPVDVGPPQTQVSGFCS